MRTKTGRSASNRSRRHHNAAAVVAARRPPAQIEPLEARTLQSATPVYFPTDTSAGVTGYDTATRARGFNVHPDILDNANNVNTLKGMGVNVVRVQFYWDGSSNYTDWLNTEISQVRAAIPLTRAADIGLIIDLHTPPPGTQPGETAGIALAHAMFDTPGHLAPNDPLIAPALQAFYQGWTTIADAFAYTPDVVGYDLLNEPQPETNLDHPTATEFNVWNAVARNTDAIIRAAPGLNHNRTVLVESVGGNPDWLKQLNTSQFRGESVEYSFHFYPTSFCFDTSQNAQSQNEINNFNAQLIAVRNFQLANNARIYVGEFNAEVLPGDTARDKAVANFLATSTNAFESYHWDWTVQIFEESPVWDLEQAFDQSAGHAMGPLWDKSTLLTKFAKNTTMSSGSPMVVDFTTPATDTAGMNKWTFYARYYMAVNPDVAKVYGKTNWQGALQHWLTFGINEGRMPNPSFSPPAYFADNPGLGAALGYSYANALEHWLDNGIGEGRSAR